MKLSDAGLAQIAHNEGLRLTLYFDHKGWSIGHGHLCTPAEVIKFKNGITPAQADELLRTDAANAENNVNRMVKVPLTQAQFDALVDFAYNEGAGNFAHIAETLNTGDHFATALRMKLYIKVEQNGVLVDSDGLKARRDQEAKNFL